MSTYTESQGQDQMAPADELLATLLAEGWTHRRVASFCGISTKTIQRRLNVEEFAQKVSLLRRQRLSETISRMTRISEKAVDVLEDAMDDEDVKVRMGAAKASLDHQERYHRRAIFEADIEHRMAAIEEEFSLTGLDGEAPVGDPDVGPIEDLQDATQKMGGSEADDPELP